MIKTCVFDAGGSLINIGEWDYQYQQVEVSPAEFDEEGNVTKEAQYEAVATNPMPEGATVEEREVIYDAEHGWRLAGDPIPKTPQQEIDELKQLVADLASLALEVD